MFKLKDYIFVPGDVLELGKKFWFWQHYTDWLGVLLVVLYWLVFGYLWGLPGEPLFFFGFIMAIIYWGMDSRVSIALALLCLVSIPVLLTLFNKNILFQGEMWAEQVAVWAYYFLAIGVVRQIFEYRIDAKISRKIKEMKQKAEEMRARPYRKVIKLRKNFKKTEIKK